MKKLNEIAQKELEALKAKKMTRKEALKKTGFVALSAATMLMLLNNPAKGASGSAAPPPIW